MSVDYMTALKSQLSHGRDVEIKYINSTMNKMFKVELDMVRREIEQIKDSLVDLEKSHNMSSDVFYEMFNAGELGDDREYMKWYAYKDTYEKLKERAKGLENIIHA